MGKEQAIEKLNDIRCHVKETSAEEQALVMAIDALKQPVATDTNVGDTISRQAVIDVLHTRFRDGFDGDKWWNSTHVLAAIEGLPSAQPEQQHGRVFKGIVVEYPEYKGKPYFSIKYTENGQEFIGYSTYKLEVLSEYLKEYFMPPAQPEPHWIPVSERLPSKEERKEWIDNNLDGIGYLYPCLVTRYSSINPDRTKNNPYVAKHYFDGEDFLNAGEEVCSEYIIAWMPLPEAYKPNK